MKVKYTGACKDFSGYGEAARHDVAALLSADVNVTTEIPVYTPEAGDYGKIGQLSIDCENKPLGYRIKILHTTPNVYQNYLEADKYIIGRAFWETNKVPLDFAQNLNIVNEIWTGSKYNEMAIRNAGVMKPSIYLIPEAIDDTVRIEDIKPYITDNKNDFKFYSVFEWTERKNPKGLLTAFWKAFEGKKGVSLMIKTYVDNFSKEKKTEIDNVIRKLKLQLGLKSYAPVYLYRSLMTRPQIYRFHKTGDCFVSAHRGEGWGIPQMEAMLLERPIISTNCGGIHEYLSDKKDSLLISYNHIPVENTRNQQWYTPDQKWAEPNEEQLIENMRWVFKNKDKAKQIGIAARKTVINKFGLRVVGGIMKERLNAISNSLYETV